MKLAVMQPYLFPYIGYFQLVSKVDKFIFLDDVNFIKKGWVNRNRFIVSGQPIFFTCPLKGVSQNKKISEIQLSHSEKWEDRFKKTLRNSYSKAPFFEAVYPIIENVLGKRKNSISLLAADSIIAMSEYLNINTKFSFSSSLENSNLKGEERILDICEHELASTYFNLPGGVTLYSEQSFDVKGIAINFISPNIFTYPQFSDNFIPGMSIIDVLMHCDPSFVKGKINESPAN